MATTFPTMSLGIFTFAPQEEKRTILLSESTEKVLRFIKDYFRTADAMPTIREIMRYMGFRSTNAVYKHLQKLQREGKVFKTRRGRLTLSPSR